MAISNAAFAMVSGLFALVPGGLALLALALAAAICVIIALSIGELASMWPSAPAVLTYFRAAFGHRAALALIHLYLLFVVLVAGVESYSFAVAVHAVVPQMPTAMTILLLLSAVVLVNLRGLALSRRAQIVTAFAAMALLIGFGAAGVGQGETALLAVPAGTAWGRLPGTVALAVFIYTGFEWVTPVGLSRDAYARRVPVSMLLALGALFVTYGLFVAGLGATIPAPTIAASATPQVLLFGSLGGNIGLVFALLLAFGAIFSTFNAGILGGAQLLQAMARERTLPH
nr:MULTISPECIES: amino acid permease [unclassified Sphingomonas]